MAERIDDLQFEGLKIYQNDDGYCFTTDSVLLANYSKCLAKAKVVEFCAGSGVVSILFSKKQKPQSIHAFELQKSLYDLFVKSVELNNLQDKIFPLNEDLKNAASVLGLGFADVVMCNPPYFKVEEKKEHYTQKQIAETEACVTLEEIISSAEQVLKFGGKFYMVHRADRLVDIIYLLRKYKLEPKKLTPVYPKQDAEPVVVLVEALKGGKAGVRISKPAFADQFNKSVQSFK